MNPPNFKSACRKILLVDDDPAFCAAAKHALLAPGQYSVRTADSGESAIEALEQERFDVILLDYRLPGMSGLEVLQWLGEQKIDTPAVILTAVGAESVGKEAIRLGAYDYMRKENFEIDHIGILVEGIYERYRFRKEKERWKAFEQERENSLVAIEMFHGTLASIATVVNRSLSAATQNMRDHEARIRPYVQEPGKQPLSQVFIDMQRDYNAITSSVRSMLEVANVLHGNFTNANYTRTLHDALQRNLDATRGLGLPPPDNKER